MKKVFMMLLLGIAARGFGQQYSQKWSDVNYVGDGQVYHNLDIYLPKTVKSSYPVVVYIYGSAWQSNNSKTSDMNTVGAALLDAGYAVVSINHRSSSDAKWPVQINDVKAAIRFVRGNAAQYKFDTCFVGISGSSSGGHLASIAGTSRGVKSFTVGSVTMNIEGTLGKFTKNSSSVDAVCDWFGPMYLLKMDSCGNTTTHGADNSPGSMILGCAIKQCTDNEALLEAKTYIDPSDPPFLIFHGTSDNVVPYCASVFLNRDLKAKGVQSEYVEVPGGQHYGGVHIAANFTKMVTFFNSVKNVTCSAVAMPTVSSSVAYCQGATAVALTATGTALKWYSAASGGTALSSAPIPSTAAVGSTDYYVSQTVNGTESARAKITVTVSAVPSAPVVVAQVSYKLNETATALSATGSGLLWYDVASGGTGTTTAPKPVTTAAGSKLYYVSQTVNGCESGRSTIEVTVVDGSVKIPLTTGWNWIGCPLAGSTDLAVALSSIWANVSVVKDMQAFYMASNPAALNSLKTTDWGMGYMVKVTKDCELQWTSK